MLPLAPGYVSYIAGQPQLTSAEGRTFHARGDNLLLSLYSVLGFSTVFVALGASANVFSALLLRWRYELGIAGGALIFSSDC